MEHPTPLELTEGLEEVLRSPHDEGPVMLIVRRQGAAARDVLPAATLDVTDGLVGDTWRTRGSRRTPDGLADPKMQLTVMNARAAALIAVEDERWKLAGDQLYADLDLSEANLPPGTRLAVGSAMIEVTDAPHLGCAKFQARFGDDALRFVNSEVGRTLRLRGVNTLVVQGGRVALGDEIRKVGSPASGSVIPGL
ncbi:MAG TPA: MOSC domain-containing protein [Acidimicrobiia bacterium]|nr:MOSC domain-containing protein [Acidimicrobiia bacterium]